MTKEQIDAVKNFAAANKLSKEALTEYVTLSKAAKNNFESFKAEQTKAMQAAPAKPKAAPMGTPISIMTTNATKRTVAIMLGAPDGRTGPAHDPQSRST